MPKKGEPTHEQIKAEIERFEILGGVITRLPNQTVIPRGIASYSRQAEPQYAPAYEPDLFAGTFSQGVSLQG